MAFQQCAGLFLVVELKPGTRTPAVDNTLVADPAVRPRKLLRCQPGHGDRTPFAADTVGAQMRLCVNGDTGTASRADDDRMDDMRTGTSAIRCFGNRKAVCIILDTHGPADHSFQVLVQRFAVHPCRIRILDEPGLGRQRAGNAEAKGACLTCRGLGSVDKELHSLKTALVVVAWRIDTLPEQFLAIL